MKFTPLILTPLDERSDYFRLVEDFRYEHPLGTILVPKGFDTDFASIPAIFRVVLSPTGSYRKAAVIHDFMYWFRTLGAGGPPLSREIADTVFYDAMTDEGVSGPLRAVVYRGVRVGGWAAWADNSKKKALVDSGDTYTPVTAFRPRLTRKKQ